MDSPDSLARPNPVAGHREGSAFGLKDFAGDMPAAGRAYVLAVTVCGVPLFLYCLAYALRHHPPQWLLLVLLAVGVTRLISVRARWVWSMRRSGGFRSPHSSFVTPIDFFLLCGIVFFSPEVGGLIGGADGFLLCLGATSRRTRYRAWFNLSSLCLVGWSFGKLFYWSQSQDPPLDYSLIDDPVWLVLCLYITVALHILVNCFVNGVAIWLGSRRSFLDIFKNHIWFVFPGMVGATGASVAFLFLRDHYWLAWLAAVPVVLISHRGNKAMGDRVNTLLESRELLQDSLDALTAHVAILDGKGRILAVNKAWKGSSAQDRLFGSRILEGQDYLRICAILETTLADSPLVLDAIQRVQRGELSQCRLDYTCGPAAPDIWFQLGVSRFESSRGGRVIVSHQEITELKMSEWRARESERNYRSFFEEDLTGDFVADGGGVLTDCNPAFARILGFPSAEAAVGASFFDLFPEPSRVEELLRSLRRRLKLEYEEVDLIHAAGGRVNAVANLSGRVGNDGRLLEVRGYLFDDTRRKRLEAELMQARKMDAVGQLAGGIAHEFNNILTVVMGRADYLKRSLRAHAELSDEASLVLSAARQGSRLTKRFQVFDHQGPVETEAVALDELVKRMEPMLRKVAGPEIRVQTSLAAGEARLLGDPAQIEQVILNLVVNARDAMPKGGELRVETELILDSGLPLRLRVADTGLGMSSEVKGRIFEPFFTTKPQGRGTGLGLATVSGIVQQSGGRIQVDSELGRGSRFELRFPLDHSFQEPQRRELLTEERPRGWETILLVEDQKQIRELVGRTLREQGYRVVIAKDGVEAVPLAKICDGPIHLLVTDIVMPRMSGWHLAERVRTCLEPHPRVLFITGYGGRRSELETTRHWTAADRLNKPFTPTTLLRRVRALLDSG